jgi:hypothetical protein
VRIVDGTRTEIEQRRLNETAVAWKRRVAEEVRLMLGRTPQETANEGAGLLISDLIDEDD